VSAYFLSIILSSFFIMPSSFFIIASPLDMHPLNVSPAAMTIAAAAAVHRPALSTCHPPDGLRSSTKPEYRGSGRLGCHSAVKPVVDPRCSALAG
jgi:hypothetical protein